MSSNTAPSFPCFTGLCLDWPSIENGAHKRARSIEEILQGRIGGQSTFAVSHSEDALTVNTEEGGHFLLERANEREKESRPLCLTETPLDVTVKTLQDEISILPVDWTERRRRLGNVDERDKVHKEPSLVSQAHGNWIE